MSALRTFFGLENQHIFTRKCLMTNGKCTSGQCALWLAFLHLKWHDVFRYPVACWICYTLWVPTDTTRSCSAAFTWGCVQSSSICRKLLYTRHKFSRKKEWESASCIVPGMR